MKAKSPKIGFDRFIELHWAATALHVRSGMATLDELDAILNSSHAGSAAKKKTRTVLNRLWLEPRADLVGFAERGIQLFHDAPASTVAPLTWGMALATYPFFGCVAEIIGRLTAIQGDCTSSEVHRRMAETYGEREGTRRMTNMVLQSQANWGAIERINRGRRIVRKNAINLYGEPVSAWLAEAFLRFSKRAISVTNLDANPAIYPFILGGSTTYLLSKSPWLELRTDSAGNQVIALTS